MTHVVDPLRALRPLREEEIELLTAVHEPDATPLAYDVYRDGDELVIEFDAPGVAPSDINVTIEGQAVVVAVRRELAKGPGVDVIESGRQHGTFRRRLRLGDRWDLQRVRAHAHNGALSVRAPLAAAQSRRVEVTTSHDVAPESTYAEFDVLVEDSSVHTAA